MILRAIVKWFVVILFAVNVPVSIWKAGHPDKPGEAWSQALSAVLNTLLALGVGMLL